MRLGISATFPHSSPEEWARLHKEAGLDAVTFPLDWKTPVATIDRYVEAANAMDLTIAEVGSWCSPMDPDPVKREESRTKCLRQLELAEYIGANCCVNVSGAAGEIWAGSYRENYSPEMYDEIVTFVQDILDKVKPVRTRYALEPMPYMLPDSPECYASLLKDVNRPGFGVHVDIVNLVVSPRVYYHTRQLVDETFELLGPHIRSCHLKDVILIQGLMVTIQETECGKGELDLPYYIQAVNKLNPELPMIIEHLSDLEQYKKSIAYIKSLCE